MTRAYAHARAHPLSRFVSPIAEDAPAAASAESEPSGSTDAAAAADAAAGDDVDRGMTHMFTYIKAALTSVNR